jgi:CheY-like chemotaxis protein
LVLDDEELICQLFRDALQVDGRCDAMVVSKYNEAEKRCREGGFDIVILDYNLADGIGWNLARTALAGREGKPAPKVVFMSGTIDRDDIDFEEWCDVPVTFFAKPFSFEDLSALLTKLLPAGR